VARPPRVELAGGIHHVYARGNRKQRLFFDDRDRWTYLRLLAAAVRNRGWHCLAYCLMGNHVHLVLETPEPNLGRGMQHLHGTFAQLLNKKYDLTGHAFEGRYRSVPILTDEQLWVTLRYIALNPVEAGLSRVPDEYRWSSHGALVRGAAPPFLALEQMLDHFEGPGDRFDRYRRFIATEFPKWV
jgi:putative transposase